MSSPAKSASPTIEPRLFYKSSPASSKFAKVESKRPLFDVELPLWLKSLHGPSPLWKVFKKQSDALQFSKDHGEGLMTFAFQEWDGTRRFLSAHPVLFWFYDCNHKRPEDRRTYEVITEGAVCKLYFDLEFERQFNSGHDGVSMTNTFIKIVSFCLKEELGVDCNRSFVLDLDSSTQSKFSRHLIFQLPKAYFRDNYNVGNFVKMVCDKVRMIIHSKSTLRDFCTKSGVLEEEVNNLFISDKHGMRKIFCDEAVYTKNRHFRLYKSTKWSKNSPLLLSLENEYAPSISGKENLLEKQLFLDSLITYVDSALDSVTILEYGLKENKKYVVKGHSDLPDCPVVCGEGMTSPEPIVDKFILSIVSPGTIRRSTYSSSLKRIMYDISGNRYCHNIGRPHKSNNVYYVVDLKSLVFYQKCHDPDCSGYLSKEKPLPPQVVFGLESEEDSAVESVSLLSENELQDVWLAVSSTATLEYQDCEMLSAAEEFPDFGMSDAELLNTSNLMEQSFI